MRHAQHFCSACSCGNWYSVVSGTYLLQGVPGSGCVLASITPHSGLPTASALTVPPAFRALPTFATFVAFTSSATLATCPTVCPALAACPVQL